MFNDPMQTHRETVYIQLHCDLYTTQGKLAKTPVRLATGVVLLVSIGFLDHEATSALDPRSGKLDRGVPAALY